MFLAFATNQTFANHITAGEISYKCLGGRTYEFTLYVYLECANSKLDDYFDIVYYSESLGGKIESLSPTSFRVHSVGQKEVPLYCVGIVTNCTFGGTERGIIKKNYQGVITLPNDAPDWVFIFKQVSRTFNNSSSNDANCFEADFIIEAKLNSVLAPCNNSPQFDVEGQSINNAFVKSQRRAESIKKHLIAHGVKEKRLVPKGYGEQLAIATNDTVEWRQLNRRAEIVILTAE